MNEPKDYSILGTVKSQAERIRQLEDSRAFYAICFVCMCVVCVILVAMKCQH